MVCLSALRAEVTRGSSSSGSSRRHEHSKSLVRSHPSILHVDLGLARSSIDTVRTYNLLLTTLHAILYDMPSHFMQVSLLMAKAMKIDLAS